MSIEKKTLGISKKQVGNIYNLKKSFSKMIIQTYKDRYLESNNPLYALSAYEICRAYNYSLPKWIQEYLDMSISNILKIDRPEKDKIATSIANAMDMLGKGRGSIFSKFHKFESDIQIALRFNELVEESEYLGNKISKEAFKYQVVEELNHSYSRVEKAIAWYKSYSS